MKNKEDTKKSKFKIKRSHVIGSPDAETDDKLIDVFVQTLNLEEISDVSNQKSILIGRTGSGKSAILKYLEATSENIQSIEPEVMSLRFLSNSNILKYFKSLDVNLTLFYKVLWKHVFIVELLKLKYKEDLVDKDPAIFNRVIDRIKDSLKKTDPAKERAIDYLKTWSKDFWLQTEYRVKSLEKKIQNEFEASAGLKLNMLNGQVKESSHESETSSIDVKTKAEKVIHDSQSNELLQIVAMMKKDIFTNSQQKFYITIDDLDKSWIEDEFRYELIAAMIEVIKEFRQLKGVKIIISLRENLNDIVFSQEINRGGQREKYRPLYCNLRWTREELTHLLDLRLRYLSGNQLDVKSVFQKTRRTKKTGLQYMLERTFLRPRDVISFTNLVIQGANNKTAVSKDIIYKAESAYSLERFQALEDEWFENFGRLTEVCFFLRGITDGFTLRSINEDKFEEIYVDEENLNNLRGDLHRSLTAWRENRITFHSFLKKLVYVLYRIGILGVKKESIYPTAFFYDEDIPVDKSDISNKCKFYVHPSLYSYFKVNVQEQLPENN